MSSKKRWQLYPSQHVLSEKLASKLQISPVIAQVLLNRGIRSLTESKQFLDQRVSGNENQFSEIDLSKALELIQHCKESKLPILIYGDYDVDGMTSTALMTKALKNFGCTVDYFIPNRFTDGYGLSDRVYTKLSTLNYGLLITLDCGISNVKEITHIKSHFNTKVLILDHHTLPDILPPADCILNPKILDSSHALFWLCTAGIVYKFLEYFCSICEIPNFNLNEHLDIVALGTVADVAPLVAENRTLVAQGLKKLTGKSNLFIKHLLEVSGFTRSTVTATDIGFVIAPRLNAAGRLGQAELGIKALLSTIDDEAKELAHILNKMNLSRRELGEIMLKDAIQCIEGNEEIKNSRVIVISSENWHSGIIGITAARLVEKYSRPVALISIENGLGRGSARSFGSVNLYGFLKECSQFFETFGGHKEAAGFSILPDKIQEFQHFANSSSINYVSEEDLYQILEIDHALSPTSITINLAQELENLAPFGNKNPAPVFYTNALIPLNFKTVGDGKHLKVTFSHPESNIVVDGIGFGLSEKLDILYKNNVEIAFMLEVNEWNGTRRPQLNIIDIK